MYIGIIADGNVDVRVPLQNLLENTVDMILKDGNLIDVLLDLQEKNGGKLILVFYFKFGSDGSSGHPKFKQLMDEERQQGHCYATGLIGMQLVAEMRNGDKIIVYNNSLVNSSLAWRPVRLWFVKETTERIIEEKLRLDVERSELRTFEWFTGIFVNFAGFYSMADMKVLYGYLGHRWTSSCPFCKAGPSEVSTPSQCLKIL